MIRQMVCLVCMMACLLSGATAMAQEDEGGNFGPRKGNWELMLSGTGANNPGFDNGAGGVRASIGYFFTKELELSARQQLNFVGTENAGSDWSGATLGAIDYHFHMDRLVPFIGIGGGAGYGENRDPVFVLAPEAGIKYYILPKTFIVGMVEYQWPVADSFEDDSQFVWTLGIGLNF